MTACVSRFGHIKFEARIKLLSSEPIILRIETVVLKTFISGKYYLKKRFARI